MLQRFIIFAAKRSAFRVSANYVQFPVNPGILQGEGSTLHSAASYSHAVTHSLCVLSGVNKATKSQGQTALSSTIWHLLKIHGLPKKRNPPNNKPK